MSDGELVREKFEKWAATKGLDLCPCDNGRCGDWRHYQFDATIWAWQAWQAASEITQGGRERAARKIAPLIVGSYTCLADYRERVEKKAAEVLQILKEELPCFHGICEACIGSGCYCDCQLPDDESREVECEHGFVRSMCEQCEQEEQ
jgi:hypothetical protein